MSFSYNGTGVRPSGSCVPAGDYLLKVVDTEEGKSKKKDDGSGGDYQVTVHFKIADGPYKGRSIKFHRVTFLPKEHKAAGIAVHFLKTLGQPWEGVFTVDHAAWRGQLVQAKVTEEEYNGYINNKVAWVNPAEDVPATVVAEAALIEEVPF